MSIQEHDSHRPHYTLPDTLHFKLSRMVYEMDLILDSVTETENELLHWFMKMARHSTSLALDKIKIDEQCCAVIDEIRTEGKRHD